MSVWRRSDGHGFPSLLTTNLAGRRRVFSDQGAASLLLDVLREIETEENFRLLAFVIMPDHLHLVAWLPSELPTGRVMKMIKGRFARQWQDQKGIRGAFWQSRYHEKALRSDEQLWDAIEYVHYNPVTAGLA